jgi:hypothetical protein
MLVLMRRSYNTLEERSFEEWSSILDLSTRWGFTSIRDLAIRRITCVVPPHSQRRTTRKPPIKPPVILSQLLLARKHAVEHWIVPALLELCKRPEPLSLEEARLMDLEDVFFVGSVRQTIRSPTLMVRGGGIRNCIQAWKSGEPWSLGLESPGNLVHEPQGNTPPTGGEMAKESGNPLPDGLEYSEKPFPDGLEYLEKPFSYGLEYLEEPFPDGLEYLEKPFPDGLEPMADGLEPLPDPESDWGWGFFQQEKEGQEVSQVVLLSLTPLKRTQLVK